MFQALYNFFTQLNRVMGQLQLGPLYYRHYWIPEPYRMDLGHRQRRVRSGTETKITAPSGNRILNC
jgi:hypothetical protein